MFTRGNANNDDDNDVEPTAPPLERDSFNNPLLDGIPPPRALPTNPGAVDLSTTFAEASFRGRRNIPIVEAELIHDSRF